MVLDTVQTGTGKVDSARKFKCTTAVRAFLKKIDLNIFIVFAKFKVVLLRSGIYYKEPHQILIVGVKLKLMVCWG